MKWLNNVKLSGKIFAETVFVLILSVALVIVMFFGIAGKYQTLITTIVLAVILLSLISLIVYFRKHYENEIGKIVAIMNLLAVGKVNLDYKFSEEEVREQSRKDELGALYSGLKNMSEGIAFQIRLTKGMAEGDLTPVIELRSEDDIVNKGLSELLKNLNELLINIVTSSESVSDNANNLSSSSYALSQGATEQASAIEQLTSSLDQLAEQTGKNANNAENANELTQNAASQASAGNEHMSEMLSAMEEINQSSANIGRIIKVIDDIAFQTNILALNAAVEAARAGQHGKGFAVVAEEVRTLAAKSANAAKETTELIEGSIRKTEAGTRIANNTAVSLRQIVEQVNKAASLISEIAIASREQAVSISQIHEGIRQVSQVVQTNVATSEESAAASEQLASEAEKLKADASTFKINRKAYSAAKMMKKSNNQIHTTQSKPVPKIALSNDDFGKY